MRQARGYRGAAGRHYRVALTARLRAGAYAYRDRRNRKREMRALWITRLSAACRERGLVYSRFISALRQAGVALNRKMLSELAIHDPAAFDRVVETVRPYLASHVAA